MADSLLEHPRLVAISDLLDPDRSDLDVYAERGTEQATRTVTEIPGDVVETWVELTEVALPLVSFRHTFVFASDGARLTSDSTLRFRGRDEVATDLAALGYAVEEVRDAPDRPGRELVFVARRT